MLEEIIYEIFDLFMFINTETQSAILISNNLLNNLTGGKS